MWSRGRKMRGEERCEKCRVISPGKSMTFIRQKTPGMDSPVEPPERIKQLTGSLPPCKLHRAPLTSRTLRG